MHYATVLSYDMQPWCIITYTKRKSKFDLTDETSREMWDTWDPTLISEVNISMNTIWGNFDSIGEYGLLKCRAIETFRIIYNRAQGLFAAANIFSSLKLVYIFSVNPYLGPLQVIWHARATNCKSCKFSFWPFSNHGGELVCASNIISARCHWTWWFSNNVQLCKIY